MTSPISLPERVRALSQTALALGSPATVPMAASSESSDLAKLAEAATAKVGQNKDDLKLPALAHLCAQHRPWVVWPRDAGARPQ
jgi:hypothetical protein